MRDERFPDAAEGAPRSEDSAGVFTGGAGGHSEDPERRGAPSAATPGDSLSAAFTSGRPALVAYVMGGYPDRSRRSKRFERLPRRART